MSSLLLVEPFSGLAGLGKMAVLAVVQGLTEFLPVSSSGHLVLAQYCLDFREPAITTDIALHIGTVLAVLLVYRRDLLAIVRDALSGKPREVLLLGVGTIPAGLFAVLLKKQLDPLFEEPILAASGLLVTACVLFVGDLSRRRAVARERAAVAAGTAPAAGGEAARPISWIDALLIGCAQAVAICPGVSRSGSTISTGLMRGIHPQEAARFSFLLSIPAILGAAVLELRHGLGGGSQGGLVLLLGVLLAAVVGWASLRLLLAFVSRGAFRWFALYCLLLGLSFLALLAWSGA